MPKDSTSPRMGLISQYFKPVGSKPDPKPDSEPESTPESSEREAPKTKSPRGDSPRDKRRKLAQATLDAIEEGSYTTEGETYDLRLCTQKVRDQTRYYAPVSSMSNWTRRPPSSSTIETTVSVLEMSTIDGSRTLTGDETLKGKIGVLNFASAKKPGGGFLTGAQAQEESIARSSNLYPSLMTTTAHQFYAQKHADTFYSHAMIYTPSVTIFRDDEGDWLGPPVEVDVLTSAAVNAGALHTNDSRKPGYDKAVYDKRIKNTMRERMARVLFLFECSGTKHLVLGSFGTGVFQNNVGTVARLWKELLVEEGARFKDVFETVVFAIIGTATFETFEDVFT